MCVVSTRERPPISIYYLVPTHERHAGVVGVLRAERHDGALVPPREAPPVRRRGAGGSPTSPAGQLPPAEAVARAAAVRHVGVYAGLRVHAAQVVQDGAHGQHLHAPERHVLLVY